jgi:S-adenosylmethionine hydrolase
VAAGSARDALDVRIGTHRIARVVSTYADVPAGELCALFGGTDNLEIASNGSSAARMLDLGCGTGVEVVRHS